MKASCSTLRSGFALYLALLTMIVVFGAVGSAIAVMFDASRSVRFSAESAGARSLAEGAWLAARTGLANEGSAYAGIEGMKLGGGTITVKITRESADSVKVIACGETTDSGRTCSERIFATVVIIDANPVGAKTGGMVIRPR